MFKKEKGITLVALVITIIVLLILAGVSISMVLGENGIATKAKEAASDTEVAKAQEAVNLAISTAQTEYYADFAEDLTADDPAYTYGDIQDNLNGYTICADTEGTVITTTDVIETNDVVYLKEGNTVSYKVTFTVSGEAVSAVVVAK